LPVETFNIPHRRGKFAYTEEIAAWLSSLKFNDTQSAETADARMNNTKEKIM
jgi:hypothetical protein